MDVDGSPVAVDLWDSSLELEGLEPVFKRTTRNAAGSRTSGKLTFQLVLSLP